MANKIKFCKSAVNTLVNRLHNPNQVNAFSRKYNPQIGEELTHKITGQRFFKNADLVSKDVTIFGAARELTKDGYRGITREQFEALKKMKLEKDEFGTIKDRFTGTEYWYGNMGLPMSKNGSSHGSIPTSLWEKIQGLFS